MDGHMDGGLYWLLYKAAPSHAPSEFPEPWPPWPFEFAGRLGCATQASRPSRMHSRGPGAIGVQVALPSQRPCEWNSSCARPVRVREVLDPTGAWPWLSFPRINTHFHLIRDCFAYWSMKFPCRKLSSLSCEVAMPQRSTTSGESFGRLALRTTCAGQLAPTITQLTPS